MKMNNFDDTSHSKTKSRNLHIHGKGVLPNIMKLRQICNFAEFTDFGINGNGSTEFSNRECALQFLEHSAKLKVRHSKKILQKKFTFYSRTYLLNFFFLFQKQMSTLLVFIHLLLSFSHPLHFLPSLHFLATSLLST
jgi:hypothetical protein